MSISSRISSLTSDIESLKQKAPKTAVSKRQAKYPALFEAMQVGSVR